MTAVVAVTDTAIRLRSGARVREAPPQDVRIAVDGLDDELTLAGDRVVPSRAVWSGLLDLLVSEDDSQRLAVVHPTAWSPARCALLSDAAAALADTVVLLPRAEVLAARAVAMDVARRPAMVVEVESARVVVVMVARGPDGEPAAVPRHVELRGRSRVDSLAASVAAAVARLVGDSRPGLAAVLVDTDDPVLGDALVQAIEAEGILPMVSWTSPDAALYPVSLQCPAKTVEPVDVADIPRGRRVAMAMAAVMGIAALGVWGWSSGATSPPSSLLVEGRVQLLIPASWAVRRIPFGGNGSARVEVISPSDPRVIVHVTQVRVPVGETLQQTAETLRRAMDKESAGVFAEFRADDRREGRAAVTYTEIRDGRDIEWSVLLDDRMRIGIGCQAPAAARPVAACDLAQRTAAAVR